MRDGMYFLPEQVAEYDRKKLALGQTLQEELFVVDEASAIAWLRNELREKPQTFQDIHPKFIEKLTGWSRNEIKLELSELLEENFLCYDGTGEVPSQIHSYLSTNYKDLRNLLKMRLSCAQKPKTVGMCPIRIKRRISKRCVSARFLKNLNPIRLLPASSRCFGSKLFVLALKKPGRSSITKLSSISQKRYQKMCLRKTPNCSCIMISRLRESKETKQYGCAARRLVF